MIAKQRLPQDWHSITPYFTVDDADRLIEFLTAAFGASLIKESRSEDRRIQHARLRIGDSVIMLNESSDLYPTNTSQMHLYVDDADAVYDLALQVGAVSLMEPNDRPHGDRMAGVKDPCGNVWWLATHQSFEVGLPGGRNAGFESPR
ncbi:MAG: VOC family protein [Pseudomonadota bacterium]